MRHLLFLIILFLSCSVLATEEVRQNNTLQEQEVGTVYVYRNQYIDNASSYRLIINGYAAADLLGYSYTKFNLKSGSYQFELAISGNPAVSLYVESGKSYYLFVEMNMLSKNKLVSVDVAVGESEILKLKKKIEVSYDDLVDFRDKLQSSLPDKATILIFNAWDGVKVPITINKIPLAEIGKKDRHTLSYLRVIVNQGVYEIDSGNGLDNLQINAEAGQVYTIFQGIGSSFIGKKIISKLHLKDKSYLNRMPETVNLVAEIDFNPDAPSPFVLRDGSTYQGEFKDALPNGIGRIIFSKKSKDESYEGDVKFGVPDGEGVVITKDGTTYTGDFKMGKANGKGIVKYSNGLTYAGDFVSGAGHGKGIFNYIEGATYEGDIKKGAPDGHGKYTRSDGSFIVGEFKGANLVSGQFYTPEGNLIQNNAQSTTQSNSTASSSEVASFLSDLAIFTLNLTNAIVTGYNEGRSGHTSNSLNSELLNSDSRLKNNTTHQSDFSSVKRNTTQQPSSIYDSGNRSESYNSNQQPSSTYDSGNRSKSYNSNSCTSDFNCGTGYSCVKKLYSNDGVCLKSVDSYGMQIYNSPSADSIGVRTSKDRCNFDTDCPVRFRCDANLKACVQ